MRAIAALPALCLPLGLAFSLSGCIAQMAADVVTAPVRAVSQVADWTTTSQSEADRNRGRAMREREEERGRLQRQLEQSQRRCERGDTGECRKVTRIEQDIEALENAPTPR